jgi:hypothetical protein
MQYIPTLWLVSNGGSGEFGEFGKMIFAHINLLGIKPKPRKQALSRFFLQ